MNKLAVGSDWLVGVDIGGTFTDVAAINAHTGELRTAKVLTDQAQPERGVSRAVQAVGEGAFAPAAIREVIHGTTLAINTVLERNGPDCALITTKGFRDVLEIGNGSRYDIYDLQLTFPPPLIPRRRRFEATERTGADGQEIVPLDRARIEEIGCELKASGIGAVAICFLHSYASGAHEAEAAEVLRGVLPDVHISLSSEVAPIIREYERTIATAMNAYVGPVAASYLGRLSGELKGGGYAGPISIMKSDGGTCSLASAAARPVQILESGPAAGVLAMAQVAEECGCARVVAFDMGGTTAKACLIADGRPGMTGELEVGREKRFKKGSGMPVRLPSVDLVEVGAGGNSIARRTELGLLAVGPESADSNPGPACYGLGGDLPTVTDADLVLGYLDPAYFAAGSIALDLDAARRAIGTRIADGTSDDAIVEAAWAIHDLVNETMAQAIRLHCVEHGIDPADITLIATGGAGPVHVASVMAKLGTRHAICPPNAGVASAVGLAIAPQSFALVTSERVLLETLSASDLEARFVRLAARARQELGDGPDIIEQRWLEVRLEGQGHELRVDLDAQLTPDVVAAGFADAYQQQYGRQPVKGRIEIVNWAVRLVRPRDSEQQGGFHGVSAPALNAVTRRIHVGPARLAVGALILTRADLGEALTAGPLVIQDAATGIVVPPGFGARVDARGNVHLEAA